MTAKTNNNVQLLAVIADFNDEEESEYRFLVEDKHVKYVTVDPGVFPKDDLTFAPVLIPMLPPFPPGPWNEGHISKDPLTGHPVFSRITQTDLPGIRTTWHHTKIDFLQLKDPDRVRQNIHRVTCPQFDHPVLVKFAEFPWQIPFFEAETAAYQWVDGKGVGPRFLGHLTEAGRVMGFVMECIDGARTAGPEDLAACQSTLARLHALGIKHGDINKHNFLVKDGNAVLVDFETAQRCSVKEELEAEYRCLEQSLEDPSYRGGPAGPVTSEHFPG